MSLIQDFVSESETKLLDPFKQYAVEIHFYIFLCQSKPSFNSLCCEYINDMSSFGLTYTDSDKKMSGKLERRRIIDNNKK